MFVFEAWMAPSHLGQVVLLHLLEPPGHVLVDSFFHIHLVLCSINLTLELCWFVSELNFGLKLFSLVADMRILHSFLIPVLSPHNSSLDVLL